MNLSGYWPHSSAQPLDEYLTNRKLNILELLSQRLQTKEIAEKLVIYTKTVNSHLKSIYRKLDVHNLREAVEKAASPGILTIR
jgi:DNA-binding NarL/FixJ family response regulator